MKTALLLNLGSCTLFKNLNKFKDFQRLSEFKEFEGFFLQKTLPEIKLSTKVMKIKLSPVEKLLVFNQIIAFYAVGLFFGVRKVTRAEKNMIVDDTIYCYYKGLPRNIIQP